MNGRTRLPVASHWITACAAWITASGDARARCVGAMLKSGSNCLRVEYGACILQPSSSAAGDAARRAELAASLGMVQAGDAKASVYCVSRHLPRLLDMPAAARFAYVLTNLVAAPLSSWLRGVQPLQPEVGACSIAT